MTMSQVKKASLAEAKRLLSEVEEKPKPNAGYFYDPKTSVENPYGRNIYQRKFDLLNQERQREKNGRLTDELGDFKPINSDVISDDGDSSFQNLEDEGFGISDPSLSISLKSAGKNKKTMTNPTNNKMQDLDNLIKTTPKAGKITKPGEETNIKDFFQIYPEQEFYDWTSRAWKLGKEDLENDKPRLANLQKIFVQKQGLNKTLGDTHKGTKGSNKVSDTLDALAGTVETPEEVADKKKQYNMGVHSHGDVATNIFDVDASDKGAVNSKRVMTQRLENDLLSQDSEGNWKGKFINRNKTFLEDPDFMEKFMFTVEKSAFEFTDMIEKFLAGKPVNIATVVEFYKHLEKAGIIEPQAFNKIVNREAQAMLHLFDLVKDTSGAQISPEDFLIEDMEESLVIPENIISRLLTRTPEQVERLLREQFPHNAQDEEGMDLIKQMVDKIVRFQQLETEGTSQGIANLSAMLKAELEGGDYDHNVDEIDAMQQGFEKTGQENKDKFLASVRQELSDLITFFKEHFVSGENVFWSFQNYVTKKFNPAKLRVPEDTTDSEV